MESLVHIDNINISATYGLRLGDGSLASLLEWPSLKEVYYNDWHEEDGLEPDLSAPVLDTRECTLSFVGNATLTQVDEFVLLLRDGAYHTFWSNKVFTYTLRLVRVDSVKWYDNLCVVRMTFADDTPLADFTPSRPSSTISADRKYRIDNTPLTTYNVNVLEGINAELLRLGEVKENLVVSTSSTPGISYDSEGVIFKAREVRIPCLMTAPNVTTLRTNYYQLLHDITTPGEHIFMATPLGMKYLFHYVSSNMHKAYLDNKLWLQFDIVVNIYAAPSIISTYELDDIQQE